MPIKDAKSALGVDWVGLHDLTRIEFVEQRWRDGKRQTAIRLPSALVARLAKPEHPDQR